MLASASMGPAYSIASTMGVMVAAAGSATPLALLACGAIMAATALVFARLATVWPDAGSSYGWARRAFGEGAGAYTAWILILANAFAVLAIVLPAGAYTLRLIAPERADSVRWEAAVGCLWIVASAVVLRAGMRPTARVTAALLVAELVVLGASAAVAFFSHPAPTPVIAGPPTGLGGFVTAMVLGIWVLDGWEVSAATSEETAGPARDAGRGGLAGLVITCAIVVTCMAAYLAAFGPAAFVAHQTDVLAYVGERLGGPWRALLVVTALVSLAATLQTTILYLVRSVYAMGRDGVLPAPLGRLARGSGDPDVALAALTVLLLVATVLTGFVPSAGDALAVALDGSSFFLGALFVTSCASALRAFGKDRPLPAAGALVALTGILAVMVAQSSPITRWSVVIGAVLGAPLALLRARARTQVPAPAVRNIGG